jgi:hypothetical protein
MSDSHYESPGHQVGSPGDTLDMSISPQQLVASTEKQDFLHSTFQFQVLTPTPVNGFSPYEVRKSSLNEQSNDRSIEQAGSANKTLSGIGNNQQSSHTQVFKARTPLAAELTLQRMGRSPQPIPKVDSKWQKRRVESSKDDKTAFEMLSRLPQSIIEPVELYKRLRYQYKSENIPGLWIVTRLFYAIASPEAIYQLRDAACELRLQASIRDPDIWKTVADTMQEINRQNKPALADGILRRCALIRLLEQESEKVREVEDEELSGTIQAESRGITKTITLARAIMLREAYPQLPPNATIASYPNEGEALQRRIRTARN